MITIDNVIGYFLGLKFDYDEQINDILFEDIEHSLTFKQLQNIDHLRTRLRTIYEIIDFLEEERKENDIWWKRKRDY